MTWTADATSPAVPIAVFLADPAVGLILAGDPWQAEEVGAWLSRRLGGMRVGPADDLERLQGDRSGGPAATSIAWVTPAVFEDPARIALLRRAPALCVVAPGGVDVPAALHERCALVLTWDGTPGPAALSGASGSRSIRGAAERLVAGPAGPIPELADLTVRLAAEAGVAAHELEYRAARAAAIAASLGVDPAQFLATWVLGPRVRPERPPPSPPPPSREDEPPGSNGEVRNGSADGPERVEPPARLVEGAPLTSHPRRRVRRVLAGRRGPRGAGTSRGSPGRLRPWQEGLPLDIPGTIARALVHARMRGWQPGERLRPWPDDLRSRLRTNRTGALVILVVDASGSMGREAMRQAKGEALRLLDRAYVDRATVAIVVARGRRAQVVLPPTRSVERARTSLRALPSGGGTPLASAYIAARQLARRYEPGAVRVVVYTDGRSNIPLEPGGDPRSDAERALAALRGSVAAVEFVALGRRGSRAGAPAVRTR